jgi:nitrogenase molybdenum-iron protein alpha chain
MGVPCKQLHSYDYGGPYASFSGAANFYKEIDRMLNTNIWKFVVPPWDKEPQLEARFGQDVRTNKEKKTDLGDASSAAPLALV